MIENSIIFLKEAIDDKNIKLIEENINEIAKNIKEYCQNPLLYTISTESIKTIINKSEINKEKDVNTICNILNKASEHKVEEFSLLLSCFEPSYFNLDECVKIISNNKIPICI